MYHGTVSEQTLLYRKSSFLELIFSRKLGFRESSILGDSVNEK
jgi:hypothetical protein